jgi:hypothetical protein
MWPWQIWPDKVAYMHEELSPYQPGAGRRPPELAGRVDEIAAFDALLIRAKRRMVDRGMVLSGLRGVGKTALLNQLQQFAEQQQWATVFLEGQTSLSGEEHVRRRFGSALTAALAQFQVTHRIAGGLRQLMQMVGTFSVTVGPVSWESTGPAATGILDVDIQALAEAIGKVAQDHDSGFAVFVDEMQDLEPAFVAALLVAQHRCQQRDLPFYVIGAGLPNLPSTLAGSRSYAERLFAYHTIGPLERAEAERALVSPAAKFGCSYSPEALAQLVEAARGYPYFLQEFGDSIWAIASDRTFTAADAEAAIRIGTARLDAGFFPSRWDRASDREREYMRALALIGDSARTADIAELLDSPITALSGVREALIRKGLVYVPMRGELAFTVPMMGDYIRRLPDTLAWGESS